MSAPEQDDFTFDASSGWRMAEAEGPGKESARVNDRASGDGRAEAGLAPQPQSCTVKVFKVGHYFTDRDRAYADGLRMIIGISHSDPGPPVAMEMSERAWAALTPVGVALGEFAASSDVELPERDA